MDIQSLMGQLMGASNPMQMMMQMLNPQQKQALNNFKGQTNEEQAKLIADYCNKNGISKEQLSNIINMMHR